MSMSSQGPGWWQASDGRWYPPEQHPDAVAAAQQPTAAGPPVGPPSGAAPGWTPLDGPTQGPAPVPPAQPAPGSPPPFGQAPPPGQPSQLGQPSPFGQPPQPPQFAQPGPYGAAAQSPRRGARPWLIVVAVLVVLGLMAGAGIWAVSSLRSDTPGGGTDIYDLSVGDCLNDPVEAMPDEVVEVDSVESVDCAEPHEAEVYALVDLPGDATADFPGDDSVGQQADEICFGRFEDYVGAPYEESSLDYSYYLPTAQSWSGGDREVACLAVDYEGELLTGSVAGSGR